ncbi:MAG: HD-GYP domain-containing protein [Planctomycetes bacterium]|nr:HD-GYP domain-containing protein [Planctomycetota bacterium]
MENEPIEPEVLARQVEKLVTIMEDVANGNYSDDIMEFTKPQHPEIIRRIAEAMGMLMVKVEAREFRLEQLIAELRTLNDLLKQEIVQTVMTIANALAARDRYSEGHAQRVAVYSQRVARRMGLPEEEAENIRIGGMLHDIGKIGFSDRVFSNENPALREEMLDEIQQHPDIGVSILKDLSFLGPVRDYVRYHHERPDGKGYPLGLRDEQIPLGAKVISVADCFDAVTTSRPYQKARSPEEAIAILRKASGTALSAEVVDAFIAEIGEGGTIVCSTSQKRKQPAHRKARR